MITEWKVWFKINDNFIARKIAIGYQNEKFLQIIKYIHFIPIFDFFWEINPIYDSERTQGIQFPGIYPRLKGIYRIYLYSVILLNTKSRSVSVQCKYQVNQKVSIVNFALSFENG